MQKQCFKTGISPSFNKRYCIHLSEPAPPAYCRVQITPVFQVIVYIHIHALCGYIKGEQHGLLMLHHFQMLFYNEAAGLAKPNPISRVPRLRGWKLIWQHAFRKDPGAKGHKGSDTVCVSAFFLGFAVSIIIKWTMCWTIGAVDLYTCTQSNVSMVVLRLTFIYFGFGLAV